MDYFFFLFRVQYTHCHDLPPQIGSCYFRAESKRFREEIDGGAWDLSRLSASLIEPMLPVSEAVACREAVRALVSNHVNIVKFAMRAVGERGNPPVSASLSGDNYGTNHAVVDYVLL